MDDTCPNPQQLYEQWLRQCDDLYEQVIADQQYHNSYSQFVNQSLMCLPAVSYAKSCSRRIVYQTDKAILYHYQSRIKKVKSTPLLIVFALINTPQILDLSGKVSFIKYLLQQGWDIYLIDWIPPKEFEQQLTLTEYICRHLHACVQQVAATAKSINLLGICQGGVLSLCYSALNPSQIKNLITVVTPVDFHTEADNLSKMIRKIDIDLITKKIGNMPGVWLSYFFLTYKPYRLLLKKYLPAFKKWHDTEFAQQFLSIERWIFNMPDQAGMAFKQFIKDFYQKNNLIKGKVFLGRKKVNLKKLTMPLLNVIAADDDIVPPSAAAALENYRGTSDYTQLTMPGGHIGIYTSPQKSKLLANKISVWLNKR